MDLPDQVPVQNSVCDTSVTESSFKGDEGYSEDTRSLDDGDSTMGIEPRIRPSQETIVDPLDALQSAIMALDESQRSEHAYNVLRTLRTSSVAAIVERLTPLLHLDPVGKLPPDITSLLFSYLEPASLLAASRVSKAWRERTLDTLLWRDKFRREGWVLDMNEVWRFERNYKFPGSTPKSLSRKATRKAASFEGARVRKRLVRDGDVGPSSGSGSATATWSSADALTSTPTREENMECLDEEMQDVEPTGGGSGDSGLPPSLERMDTSESVTPPDPVPAQIATQRTTTPPNTSRADLEMLSPVELIKDPPMIMRNHSGAPRVNFHHVFKQKRRLEENWLNGRYKSFQLPHKDHPEEAHTECVYTIQYSGNHLVSGSRDKTLRIWDLDTQRLIRRPLEGHKGSVLCLQFDDSEAEDVIVSGSSDTDVILWQFSTGKLLKRISNAHRESVLNLKFDKRFLVTCSKDKMIKIWNRKELLPGDPDYPRKRAFGGGKCPAFVLDAESIPPPNEIPRFIHDKQIKPIPEYSPIMKIDDHGAAVNAVHIYQDQLVSASGDRHVRVFDIHSGERIASCKSHTKGIACVQYDGKRIVSGSSDNTIRIFDPKSQVEVACLQGHSKLVRTVQAAFGDTPGSEEDLEKQAKEADNALFAAQVAKRMKAPPSSIRPGRVESLLPRNPEGHTTIGAKLPKGGGGSPWARIISGSYDETVIIWRKGSDGEWKVGLTLKQADALQAAGGPLIALSERPSGYARQMHHAQQLAAVAMAGSTGLQQPAQPEVQLGAATSTVPAGSLDAQLATQQATTGGSLSHQNILAHQNEIRNGADVVANNNTLPQPIGHGLQAQQQLANIHLQMAQAQLHQLPHPNAGMQPQPQPNARVFKLQFDARRIICCSQDPKIVGWDFANGDEEIIECSRFFGPPT